MCANNVQNTQLPQKMESNVYVARTITGIKQHGNVTTWYVEMEPQLSSMMGATNVSVKMVTSTSMENVLCLLGVLLGQFGTNENYNVNARNPMNI